MINIKLIVIIFGILLGLLFLSWLIISPILFVWWSLNRHTSNRFYSKHKELSFCINTGAFFSLNIVLLLGIRAAFNAAMPRTESDFDLGYAIAFLPSVLLSIFIAYTFGKYEELRNAECSKELALYISNEIERRKKALQGLNGKSLRQVKEDNNEAINKFYGRVLSCDEKVELEILCEIKKEIEKLVSSRPLLP